MPGFTPRGPRTCCRAVPPLGNAPRMCFLRRRPQRNGDDPMTPRLTTLLASALLAVSMTPAAALDVSDMTKEERAAFRAEVRAYLLDNPEVIMEAVAVLEERQTSQQAESDIA